MIRFNQVTFTHSGADRPTLVGVDFEVPEGEFALVAGRTGVGKSTLLGAVNGHVPHFTGGRLAGRVEVAGLDTRQHQPRDLAHLVGVVGQDPLAGFVTDSVEEELAYGMEQLGVAPSVMRARVEETLDLLGIADLRGRTLRTLSGGQQQRVAIGSVLAAGARVLVLDEPTSALDPTSAEEVLAALLRLVHDLGVTCLIAEHRLERVAEYADRMVLLSGGGAVRAGSVAEIMADSPIAPPVVELGRLAGWSPPPLSIRQARRLAGPWRQRLAAADPARHPRAPDGPTADRPRPPDSDHSGLSARGLTVVYGQTVAVRQVDFDLPAGQITVLMGRNGSGKSSLLWALSGVGPVRAGRWSVDGQDLAGAPAETVRRSIRLVPQNAADLLYLDSVRAECAAADQHGQRPAGTCAELLDRLAPGVDPALNPRDLSEGQRLCLAVAVQLTSQPPVLLLDEPTRGLDYPAKAALGSVLTGLAGQGRAICVATHDAEFAAAVADRVVVMATGESILTGPATSVLTTSAIFASQVAKVMSPQPWLTVAQLADAVHRDATAQEAV
ncbi:MAG: ATP-binding cassette domain-containing protein [Propionibacteriaceae bacterium]|jgi:energy-coupling factor transport system ATP-binding protein|nr:ATP-binding cassette domain-containing protein [Propionibacteriaceae bacterium]